MNNLLQLFKKSRLNRYWQRNLFYITFIMLVFVLGFWVGIANAATPRTHTTATAELYGPAKPITLDNVEQRLRSQYATSTTSTIPIPTVSVKAKIAVIPDTPDALVTVVETTVAGTPQDWMREAGIPESDWLEAELLISREGGWRPCVHNGGAIDCSYVGKAAYGIPQAIGGGTKMASEGDDWRTNPITQLRWMKKYVESTYGTWVNANAKWLSRCGGPSGCWY